MDIQKVVKSNAEEVTSFLSELSSWSQDMRAKELAESLPLEALEKDWKELCAAEAKAKAPVEKTSSAGDGTKVTEKNDKVKKEVPRRGDYTAWEKYNAEEALKNLEAKRQASLPEEEIIRRKAIEIRTKKAANDKKEAGNRCIKDKNYERAVAFYSDGIRLDDKNTILYANRAQAYLYLEDYENAKDDCERALKLDSTYIKAVFRRAKAHVGLGLIEKAKADLKLTLSLDPKNSEAIQILNGLLAKNKKVPPAVAGAKPSTSKSAYSPMVKSEPASSQGQRSTPMSLPFDSEIRERTVRRFSKPQPHQGDGDTVNSEKSPDVFPRFIQPIHKSEHERSNVPLVSIPVKIVGGGAKSTDEEVGTRIEPISKSEIEQSNTPLVSIPLKIVGCGAKSTDEDVGARIEDSAKKLKIEAIPVKVTQDESTRVFKFTKPFTTIEFYRVWNGIKDSSQQCAAYLEKFSPSTFKIFSEMSMDCATFSQILQVLHSEFLSKDKNYSDCLEGLTFISRLEILILFLSEEEKRLLRELLTNCASSSVRSLHAYKDFK